VLRRSTFFVLHVYRLGRLLVQLFDPITQLDQQRPASILHRADILRDGFIVLLVGHPHVVPQFNSFIKSTYRLIALARDCVVLEYKNSDRLPIVLYLLAAYLQSTEELKHPASVLDLTGGHPFQFHFCFRSLPTKEITSSTDTACHGKSREASP
jgi:hypothetical protein